MVEQLRGRKCLRQHGSQHETIMGWVLGFHRCALFSNYFRDLTAGTVNEAQPFPRAPSRSWGVYLNGVWYVVRACSF